MVTSGSGSTEVVGGPLLAASDSDSTAVVGGPLLVTIDSDSTFDDSVADEDYRYDPDDTDTDESSNSSASGNDSIVHASCGGWHLTHIIIHIYISWCWMQL